MDNGLKPIEAFYSDISNNLVKWAHDGEGTVYYETKEYWYCFKYAPVSSVSDQDFGIVVMRRFSIDSNDEISDFANKHSLEGLGKKWLFKMKDKQVPIT